MPESLLYCSLHDPVSPCPLGYVTNKVCSQTFLQGYNFVPGSQPPVSLCLGCWPIPDCFLPSLYFYEYSRMGGLQDLKEICLRMGLRERMYPQLSHCCKNLGLERVKCIPKKEIAMMVENSSLLIPCFICSFNNLRRRGESC